MRLVPIIAGALLAIFSIPAYYYSPHFLSTTLHSMIVHVSGSSTMNTSMLRQMGYPSLHEVILTFQYLVIGLAVAGIGGIVFGLVAKKIPKPIPVKLVAYEPLEEFRKPQITDSKAIKSSQANAGNEQAMFKVVNNVLTKLETELKQIKAGYEDQRIQMEADKKKLEQREREQMAKIIATGEVLIKEITPEKFEERIKYYIGLKNEETGQPVDLSLLSEKFDKMKKRLGSAGSGITPSEFENLKRFLD